MILLRIADTTASTRMPAGFALDKRSLGHLTGLRNTRHHDQNLNNAAAGSRQNRQKYSLRQGEDTALHLLTRNITEDLSCSEITDSWGQQLAAPAVIQLMFSDKWLDYSGQAARNG